MSRYARFFSKCLIFALVLGSLFVLSASSEAALPLNTPFAVMAKGPSQQHISNTEAIITRQLLAKGYKVVDPQKLNAIRRDAAARAALEGDVNAILRLSRGHGATMIVVQVQADPPRRNEFDLFTGTSDLALQVGAPNGSIIYADTARGRGVGYTTGEAASKAIEVAATAAVNGMTR